MEPKALLKRGQTVVVSAPPHQGRLACCVEDVASDRVFLTALVNEPLSDFFEPGQLVVGYVQTPVRVYQFESVVLQSWARPAPALIITIPDALTPVQRRRFFRVEVLFPVQLVSKVSTDVVTVAATGLDISAGGLGVSVERSALPAGFPREVGKSVQVTFTLPPVEREWRDPTEVQATGEIVWATQHERGLRMGIAFTDIDPKVRERIVAWCFAFHRHLIRMGLIAPREEERRGNK